MKSILQQEGMELDSVIELEPGALSALGAEYQHYNGGPLVPLVGESGRPTFDNMGNEADGYGMGVGGRSDGNGGGYGVGERMDSNGAVAPRRRAQAMNY